MKTKTLLTDQSVWNKRDIWQESEGCRIAIKGFKGRTEH